MFEGVGTAFLIPPVYILATLWFSNLDLACLGLRRDQRAGRRRRGGRAVDRRRDHHRNQLACRVRLPGPVVATIILLSRRLVDPLPPDPTRPFDAVGAILSAVGMFFVVFGILQAGTQQRALRGMPPARSRVPDRVLPLHPRPGAGGEGAAAVDRAVQEPHLQSRPRHPEHAVAASHGRVVRRLRLPAGGSRLQRDRDGRRLHRRDPRRPGLVLRSAASRQEVRAADADRGRLRRHPGRDRTPARLRPRLVERSLPSCPGFCSSASASARC